MNLRKKISLQLIGLLICTLISSCSYAQKSKPAGNSEIKPNVVSPAINIDEFLRKQILLTNNAKFSNDRTLEGASGFLIKYSGENFALTARHLLGEDGGVEPEVKINDLGKSFISWEMMPRVVNNAAKETIKLDVKGLDFSRSVSDIVLLKVVSDNFEIEPLVPAFDLPAVGEKLFLIGCPYSQTKCRQNSYEVKYVEFDDSQNALVGEINSKENLSGFSGAPLINSRGQVVGVLVGGGELEGKNYVTATHIKEIQKIKF